MIKVKKVIPIEKNTLKLTFSNGESKEIDISDLMHGKKFSPLADEVFFKHVAIDENGGIFWLNGADICADVLYQICFPD